MPINETKPWYTSRTIWGGLATILALVLGFFGYSVDEATKTLIIEQGPALAAGIAGAIGAVLTVWGRLKASKNIK